MPGLMARHPLPPEPERREPPAIESIGQEPCDRCGRDAKHRVLVPFTREGRRRLGELALCVIHYGHYLAAKLSDTCH
jgi:hypothetical protein